MAFFAAHENHSFLPSPRRSPARWHRRAASRRNARADLLEVTLRRGRADGEPTADLKAADITIKIDGRQRQIRSLQLVSLADSGPAAAPPSKPSGSAALWRQQHQRRGRSLVLALDDESFKAGQEQALRQAVDG